MHPLAPRRVVVMWQASNAEELPVGELLAHSDDGPSKFEFAYIEGVERVIGLGFQPFPAFPRVDCRYVSGSLFPFFRNRVMSANRPDYAAYVAALGLPPGTADPIDLLFRSGGRRQTDRISIA